MDIKNFNSRVVWVLVGGLILLHFNGCNKLNPGEYAGRIEASIPYEKKEKNQQIRDENIKRHPGRKVPAKVDITPEEHERFVQAISK